MSTFVIAVLIIGLICVIAWKREQSSGRLEFYRRFRRSRVNAWILPGRMRACSWFFNFAGLVCWYSGRADLMFLLIAPGMLLLCSHLLMVRRRYRRLASEVSRSNYRVCPACLYSLDGSADSGKCPECGAVFTQESLAASWAELCQRVLPGSATRTMGER